MITYSTHKTNGPHKSFWSFILTLVLVFGLFQGFLPKSASASNNYIDNISFFVDSNGYNKLSFHVLTTFNLNVVWYGGNTCAVRNQYNNFAGTGGFITDPNRAVNKFFILPSMLTGSSSCAGTYSMTAGNTYEGFITNSNNWYDNCTDYSCLEIPDKTAYTSSDYWNFDIRGGWCDPLCGSRNEFPWTIVLDTELYYFLEVPTLTITYPEDNAEIVANFYATGSFTQPTPTYEFLSIFTTIAGTQQFIRSFDQVINFATSGTMAIWVSGLPAGYYDLDFMMRNNAGGYYFTDDWSLTNIHIVNDLPYSLPPYGGQPPTTMPQVYQPLEPSAYYTANSSYSTSTGLYNTITGTFAPVLLSIGDSLVNFASSFTASNASSTGNQLGASILLIRSYVSNINSFFANFPVANFLLLYLIALVVVIVLRLVKGLIGLFKI